MRSCMHSFSPKMDASGLQMLTTLDGKKTRIQNRTAFINHFDEIFDKGIRCAILASTDKDVWGNSHGFTLEYGGTIGTIWFDGFRAVNDADYTYRLMTVNKITGL